MDHNDELERTEAVCPGCLQKFSAAILRSPFNPGRVLFQARYCDPCILAKRAPMKTLGEFIREKREAAGLSLRELARRVEITAPFLSDIELGRRAPAEKNLALIAKELAIPIEEIHRYDHRETVSDFKAAIESNPDLAMAFRTQLKQLKTGSITSADLAKKLDPK